MKLRDIFTDAVLLYIKKPWMYISFSIFITTSVFIQFYLLSSIELKMTSFVLLLLSAFVFVFATAFLVANFFKVPMCRISFFFCLRWFGIVVVCDLLYRYILTSLRAADWILHLIGVCILWITAGLITIFACRMIRSECLSSGNITKADMGIFTKGSMHFFAFAFVFVFFALSMAHPSKTARTILPPEKIAQNERVCFWIALYLLTPLYILFLTLLYEETVKRNRAAPSKK